ncbi:hypothetical protein Hanom_Chr01g00027651 [Helianthus anomalus]
MVWMLFSLHSQLRFRDKINRNSFSATGGGSLSTLLDQQLRELTAMTPALVYQESQER